MKKPVRLLLWNKLKNPALKLSPASTAWSIWSMTLRPTQSCPLWSHTLSWICQTEWNYAKNFMPLSGKKIKKSLQLTRNLLDYYYGYWNISLHWLTRTTRSLRRIQPFRCWTRGTDSPPHGTWVCRIRPGRPFRVTRRSTLTLKNYVQSHTLHHHSSRRKRSLWLRFLQVTEASYQACQGQSLGRSLPLGHGERRLFFYRWRCHLFGRGQWSHGLPARRRLKFALDFTF